jgi:hypothetical protein
MMKAVRISETSVYLNETNRRYSLKAVIFILAAVRTWSLTTYDTLLFCILCVDFIDLLI